MRYTLLAGREKSGMLLLTCAMISLAPFYSLHAECVPSPTGLLGWWRAEGTAADRMGNSNGAVFGATNFVSGRVGQAFSFNGTNSYAQIPDRRDLSPQIGPSGEVTLEAWVRLPSLPAYDTATSQANRAVVVKGSPSNWEYGLYINTNGEPTWVVWQPNGTGHSGVTLTNQVQLNTWHHFVGVFRKGQFTRLFLDGVLAGESTSFTGDTSDGSSPLYIGRRGDGQLLLGDVDEVSLYSRALSTEEVAGLFAAGSAGKCDSVPGVSVPFFADFERTVPAGLAPQAIDQSETLNFTRFLGRLGNSVQTLTLTNLSPGESYTAAFDLYIIDSWDGGNATSGDNFMVLVNGSQAWRHSFGSSSQTFPQTPDEGRFAMGFDRDYADAIYRNVQVTFTATNSITTLAFSGANLETLGNESWGLDNLGVYKSADATGPAVRSTTLPPHQSTNLLALDSFVIAATEPLSLITATNPANYTLKAAGPDNAFGTADDASIAFTVRSPGTGGRSAAFTLSNGPLAPGRYQFQTAGALQTANGQALPVFSREFTLANPVAALLESEPNGTRATANSLSVAESPVGSGFLTGFGMGVYAAVDDLEYWRFDAEAGDLITVRVEAETKEVQPRLRLRSATDQDLTSVNGGNDGVAQIQNYRISTPGTYYVVTWPAYLRSRYAVRVDQSRTIQMESESNNTPETANALELTFSPGLYQGRVAGALPQTDPADAFSLGTLNVGNSISANILYPAGSRLNTSATLLRVFVQGQATPVFTATGASLNYTATTNAIHYFVLSTPEGDLRAQYLANVTIGDGVAPVITGSSLPLEGQSSAEILDRFTLSFSEDLSASSVSNSANYELRGAGSDALFGTGDDTLYDIATSGYTSGLSAAYLISNGPLQPGKYRFSVGTGILDRAGNAHAAPYIRQFEIANLPGFTLETRNNDNGAFATPLGTSVSTNGNGTFGFAGNTATAANPHALIQVDLNGDSKPDLVTPNYYGHSVSLLTNVGDGTFRVMTNLAIGNNPISVASSDFNKDGRPDLAVSCHGNGSLTLVFASEGGYYVATNFTGFSGIYNLAAADVNQDGNPDLVVPSYHASSISVLLGTGSGTFLTRSNYATGSNPQTVATGDLNGDGLLDLAVANYGSGNVSVYTNRGNGSFGLATNLPCGANPRDVAIAEVTGDSLPDIVVLKSGDNTVAVLAGLPGGLFSPRLSYPSGTTDAYHFAVADLNGDSRQDVAVAGYGNSVAAIMLNNGTGAFTNLVNFSHSQGPIGVAAADFNADGRIDLAFARYNSHVLSAWHGQRDVSLSENPPGSGLRSAFARGKRTGTGDVDLYAFSAREGDQVMLASDVPGNPSSSSLNYAIQSPSGANLVSFNSDTRGWGESGVATIPQDGTYFVRVGENHDFQGEYRFRITLARPPLQLERENNDNTSQSTPVNLAGTGSRLSGSISGYLGYAEGDDFFSLGHLVENTSVGIRITQPSYSGLANIITVYDGSDAWVTNSTAGVSEFAFTVPPGRDGVYRVRISPGPGGFAGSAGQGLQLGGSSGVDLGNWFNLQTFTLSMWLNPAATQNQYADILDNNHLSGINWVIQQNSTTHNQYVWGVADGGAGVTFNLAPNAWQHLAITRDGTNVSTVYLDGIPIGTSVGAGQINYNGNQFLRIGRWGSGGRNWTGMFDELRIWDRALTAPEIAASLTGTLQGTESGLIGYWRFDEGFGTTAADLSTANHAATLTGGAGWAFLGPTNAAPAGLSAQYILRFDLTNNTAPIITSISLPAQGSTNSGLINNFTVGLSADLEPLFARTAWDLFKYQSSTYFQHPSVMSWSAGQSLAASLGGHLAAVGSAAENTWLRQIFSNEFWLGLHYYSSFENRQWTSGEAFNYSNWANGRPDNNSGFEPTIKMLSNGTWEDVAPWSELRPVIEVTSTLDSDEDGWPNTMDPYPGDAMNGFDLRAAGVDKAFDTADDILYRLITSYSGGLSATFFIQDGPLQPGLYRFKATTSLRDRFGNPFAAPVTREFRVDGLTEYVQENRRTNATSTTSFNPGALSEFDGSFSHAANLGTGSNPYAVATGLFNGDSFPDLVTANFGSDDIRVFLNDGSGGFTALTNISVGDGPSCIRVADFNGDGRLDAAVPNYYAHSLTVLLGTSDGSFVSFTNYSGFNNPYTVTISDLNKDGKADLAVPNYNASHVTVLFGVGDGTFSGRTNLTAGSKPETVAVGDFNNDGWPDLAVANYNSSFVSILLGAGQGAFLPSTSLAGIADFRAVAAADINRDGTVDLCAIGGTGALYVYVGKGDGTFIDGVPTATGLGDTYEIHLRDLNGDNFPEVVLPGYGDNRVYVLNNNQGQIGGVLSYNPGGNPIGLTFGDFNADARLDVATANYYGNSVSLLLGNGSQALALDPSGTGVRSGAVRGTLANASDLDYWTFSARAGDKVYISTDTGAGANSSSALYRVYYPNWAQWTYFYSDTQGRANISLTAPFDGTYRIRVEQNHEYRGEYRIRVSTVRPPVQLESEDNGAIADGNAVTYQLINGVREATVFGALTLGDTSGDHYKLGNLAVGTRINLNFSRPAGSRVAPEMAIFSPAGAMVTNALPGATNLTYTVEPGVAGLYTARFIGRPANRLPGTTNALIFNGASTYVNVGNWSPGPKWSVQAWVLPTNLINSRRNIVGGVGGCLDWGISVWSGYYAVQVRPPGACSTGYLSSVPAEPGVWAHVAASCDGTNAFLYVNGALAAWGPVDANYNPYTGGTWIGGSQCCGEYFPGAIDEVAIWNRALSAAEVAALASTPPAGSENGLVGLWVLRNGAGTTVPDLGPNNRIGSVVNGTWQPLAPEGSIAYGLMQHYLGQITLVNTIPPQVVDSSLPAEGTGTSAIIDRFTLTFSEDFAPATVTNSAHYDLRAAGPDTQFGTADDQVYTLRNTPAYSTGTNALFYISDGPLEPGSIRLTVSTNLSDPVGTQIPTPFVRNFAVTNLPGFVSESRFGHSVAQATSLSPAPLSAADGSFLFGSSLSLGSKVERIVAGHLDGDNDLDLVAAMWDADGITILRGLGNGSFATRTNYATGDRTWALALGRLNADAALDLAVVNYGANTVTILSGNGDGTFTRKEDYAVGVSPYHIVAADLNADGKLDLVIPNSGSGTISVLLGNGDATFNPAVNYAVGTTPVYVGVADLNGDGKADVAVANNDSNNLTFLLGSGDGTFTTPLWVAAGQEPRALAVADWNNDSKPDLAVYNYTDNTVSILIGDGNGSFQNRVNYATGTQQGYEIAAADLNSDGFVDLVLPGYNNARVCVLLNQSGGGFASPLSYAVSAQPVGLAVADFNQDGRLDIATGHDSAGLVYVLLGNPRQPLALDSSTGLRIAAARGTLSTSTETDFWSFYGEAGQLLYAAADVPGNPAASALDYAIYRPDGTHLTSLDIDYYGRGQKSAVLPVTGTYTLRVNSSYTYSGEYRFRITLAPAGTQVESENNDNLNNSDPLTFSLSAGRRQATVLGYIASNDSGDIFRLGKLSGGATVQLTLRRPASSGLLGTIWVYDSQGNPITNSAAGATSFTCTVPFADEFYAQVWDAGPTTALKIGGEDGYALRFNGGDNWISFTNAIIPTTGDFTVECWAYANYSSSYRELISQGGGFYLGTDGSNIRSGDSWQNTGVPFPFSGWHHLAIVKSSTNTLVFVDGVLAASRGSAIPNPTANEPLRIGRQYGNYGEYWPGSIDEVRIWNVARSASDIASAMGTRLAGTEPGLLAYWRFDEGFGRTVTSATGAGFAGVLQNSPVWLPSSAGNVQRPGLFSQYLLSLELQDSVSAGIASASLPASSTTNLSIVDRFSINLTKDIDPSINLRNRQIRRYSGHAYTLTDNTMRWYDAELQARALGGNLVTVNDAGENSWLIETFAPNFWIGLSDDAEKGVFKWSSGEAFAYTNWSSGQPYSPNNHDYAAMTSGGTWAVYQASQTYRGLIEVAGNDADNDGVPDSLDPNPHDPFNTFDLRAAGVDGVFDTADDQTYSLVHSTYSSGIGLNLYVQDGPLQPGKYRFLVTSSMRDLFGNPMSTPYTLYFTIEGLPGYVLENRSNNTRQTGTPLNMIDDPPGVRIGAGRGNLFNNDDIDYFTFQGSAGERINLAMLTPGNPAGSALSYQVFRPDGTRLFEYTPGYYGDGQTPGYTLPVDGVYSIAVSPSNGYQSEYRFRVIVSQPAFALEEEENNTIATAKVLPLTSGETGLAGGAVGRVRSVGDLDYYDLGTVTNGQSIFLSVRLPGSSSLVPIVSIYNSAGVYQPESTGGKSSDAVANVPVTQTGRYYALVRAGNSTGGFENEYVLDVNVVPTGSINFPNLIVSAVQPPTGSGIQSGQLITYHFKVENVGNAATAAADWIDRAVLSLDSVLGNTDDIPLGFFPHSGVLPVGGGYSVTNTFRLPNGVAGDYYLIVQTDAGNAVNEYLFKGDNTTISADAFHITVAPYPDLALENLQVTGPDANNVFTITWGVTNRGNALAPAGVVERIVVRNQTAGTLLANKQQSLSQQLAPGAGLLRTETVATTNAGSYQVQVVVDPADEVYEYAESGHAAAEANNTTVGGFQITAYYTVALQSTPPSAGMLSGGGKFASGTAVTVSAVPQTNLLPYVFVNWTEGGTFQSASSNYSFILTRDRVLTANFTLPTFLLSASNNPPAGGTVAGQGNFAYGSTNVLTASANFGYKFAHWTEHGSIISVVPWFTNVTTSNRFLVANYAEANISHAVTTATSPADVAVVTGVGIYTNGQTAEIAAPQFVTNSANIYSFRQFRLNGSVIGTNASFSKTFSTLDPTNLQYVAVYDTRSILPLVTNVTMNIVGIVPATTNLRLSITFNRGMDTNVTPRIALTNAASGMAVLPAAGGSWSQAAVSNDTFTPPPLTFSAGMDGNYNVWVSDARDAGGSQMLSTNSRTIAVDVTPPAPPSLAISASNSTSATVSWSGYAAPTDLNGFRIYLATNAFTSVVGMTPLSSVGSSSRAFTCSGLTLDQPYWVAVTPVDTAGNNSLGVTPLNFTLASTVPPPVLAQVSASGADSAMISWNSYNTANLLGFAGFHLYYETNAFTSVTGLAPRQTLAAGERTVSVQNLDRRRTYYFALVGYNVRNAFNPAVTTAIWRDPFAGNLTANTTIGSGNEETLDILQPITVVNNATLTVSPGTTLRFAPGAGITIEQGSLIANGTALDPIIFTSANDQPGASPAAADWKGIRLQSGAGSSQLRHVFVNYGEGLMIDSCNPKVEAITLLNNSPAGLTLTGTANLSTTNALIAFNGIGAQQLNGALLKITGSVVKNNNTNLLASPGTSLVATQNWWGSANMLEIDGTLRGPVNRDNPLSGEPLLTPAMATLNNSAQVGGQYANLRLACRTADSLRLSEDSTFPGVFFAPFTNQTAFALSSGGGQKTIFAQFRSVTGDTSAPVSLTVTYITTGPSITAFSLTEGQVIARPVTVAATATAPLGVAGLEFYLDGSGVVTNSGTSLSFRLDPRAFNQGVHRARLLARDMSGNIASRELNIFFAPTPPPAPQITIPATDLVINTNGLLVAGTAEPEVEIRLFRSGTSVGSTNANGSGNFSFRNVLLLEGANPLTAVAVDTIGSAGSQARNVVLDTEPPAQLLLDTPVYQPGVGLRLSWRYPVTGKRASTFQVFWSTEPITQANQATGSTLLVKETGTTIQGLATGDYYFYVVGYDSMGNSSPLSLPVQYRYDGVPPSFSISFDKPSPVGLGPLQVLLVASEPINGLPTLTIQPKGSTPAIVTITNAALNTYAGVISVSPLLPSGPVQFRVTAIDMAGNSFVGSPAGPALEFDVTPPSGFISTAPTAPVQTTNTVELAVSLQLTEEPKPGTTPALTFSPPIGAPVTLTVSGSGTNWNSSVALSPSMGSGVGYFTMNVQDALGNVGQNIRSGNALEIYSTELPSAPGQPVGFTASSLSDGRVQLQWQPVVNAEIYRVYSQTGTSLTVPTLLLADNVTSNSYTDLPAADGYYRYVVTASRRGAEGTPSIVRIGVSDRTPPAAPTNVVVELAASGLMITWEAAPGSTPHSYRIYRNGTLLTQVGSVRPVYDNPPRGIMSYQVAALDALGNEALSDAVAFQTLVGAVGNLQALVTEGQGPVLTWTSTDATAVGYNVYRNGIKQNSALLTGTPAFTDTLPQGNEVIHYAVTAVNSTNAESAARSVKVYAVGLGLVVNGGASPVTAYFDQYRLSVTNLSIEAFPLEAYEVQRTSPGAATLNLTEQVNGAVGVGNWHQSLLAVPCSTNGGTQTVRLRVTQEVETAGSKVVYQQTSVLPEVQAPGVMMEISANQLPLAGGLTPFEVTVYNRGYTPMYFVAARGNGSEPGDLYISVLNQQGQEVSRTQYKGVPSGTVFSGENGYVVIPAGGSTTLTVSGVLVPEALANTTVTFQAVVTSIYDRLTQGQKRSGPLAGSMQSRLAQTPYYGTTTTDFPLYSDNQPVLITGQAINRATGALVPNAPLRLGFSTRGHRWYQQVTTDAQGQYQYTYNVTPGMAGRISLWAAHPDVADQLNQAQIIVYRNYITPQAGDIRMSVNDSLPFKISLLNPGDQTLTGYTVGFQAYVMQGTNQVPISSITGTCTSGTNFSMAPGERRDLTLELTAAPDAPTNALGVFTIRSAEGASSRFTGFLTLLPAFPLVSVVQPDIGYVEASVNRGALQSRQVTVVNRGLKDLQGVSMQPPTNVTWMALNLASRPDGLIGLPDLAVGESTTFTVVFTPPTNTALGFFEDRVTIRGTNTQASFDVRLYALVTSANRGSVQFYVDDILGNDVPNASIRLRNTDLQVELPAVQTDINGLVTVTNLQEGVWSWQVTAPGYSSAVGVASVIPDQAINVAARLNRSVVTINFSVVPVPYTDRYEILLEQTFETHVPLPVLVLNPTYREFEGVTPGFRAGFIVTAKNEGLIQMENLTITGQRTATASFLPAIDYVPVLLPQQVIEIPFTVTYDGASGAVRQETGNPLIDCAPGMGLADGFQDMLNFAEGLRALANAEGRCIKDNSALKIAGAVAIAFKLYQDISGLIAAPLEQLANYIGCVIGSLLGKGLGDSSGGDGPAQNSTQNFQPGAPACFTAGTRVHLADGSLKTIAELRPGDRVRSGGAEAHVSVVSETFKRVADQVLEIAIRAPGSNPEAIRCTPDHLFWVDGRGWIAARHLKPGDWLLDPNGRRVAITAARPLPGNHEVFTIKLAGDVAFYANGVLVHDLCGFPMEAQAPPGAPPGGSQTKPDSNLN